MKIKDLIYISFIIVVGIFAYLEFTKDPVVEIKETKTVDTVRVVDTLFVDRKIEVLKWKAKIDTLYRDSSQLPQLVASADTLIQKDSAQIKVKYFFPPVNKFDLDINIKEKIVHIIDSVKVTIEREKLIEPPFYKNNWFYSTVGALILLVLSLGG